MKRIASFLFFTVFAISAFAQSFSLPGDGNWYRVAVMGGAHANFEYHYSHGTPFNPSVTSGEITYINSQNFMIQHHQTMGFQAWNQPQFALLNLGNTSEVWVRATNGSSAGTFTVTRSSVGSITSGDLHDNNLSDNGGTLTIYDKLKDNANIYYSNLIIPSGSLSVGTADIDPNYNLAVKGKIHAQEVKVEASNWPDYVFKADYVLPSLNDIKEFVRINHHLPEIPSEQEINNKGLSLGEMNKLMVKKVEELTLYLIEKDRREKEQQLEINELRGMVSKLVDQLKAQN